MTIYDRTFFRTRLGRVAKFCIVAMLAMNVVALHAVLHPDHGRSAAAGDIEVA